MAGCRCSISIRRGHYIKTTRAFRHPLEYPRGDIVVRILTTSWIEKVIEKFDDVLCEVVCLGAGDNFRLRRAWNGTPVSVGGGVSVLFWRSRAALWFGDSAVGDVWWHVEILSMYHYFKLLFASGNRPVWVWLENRIVGDKMDCIYRECFHINLEVEKVRYLGGDMNCGSVTPVLIFMFGIPISTGLLFMIPRAPPFRRMLEPELCVRGRHVRVHR